MRGKNTIKKKWRLREGENSLGYVNLHYTGYRIAFLADKKSNPVYSMNSNGMELEQVVHTCWISCPSGLPGEFGGLNPRSNSCRAFISVSVGSTLLSYLFTTATVQILGGHTAPKYGTKPLRYYVTRRFRDRRSAASIRHRNRAEIITALVCEQKPYPVWFSGGGGGGKSYPV